MRGETTPVTTYWPNALERLRRYHPQAKLIIGLRHPAFRAFSHGHMETKRNRDTLPFPQAAGTEGRQRVWDTPGGVHRAFSYVERGLCAGQVERLLALSPPQSGAVLPSRPALAGAEPDPPCRAGLRRGGAPPGRAAPLRYVAAPRRHVVPVSATDPGPVPNESRLMLDQVSPGISAARPGYREPYADGLIGQRRGLI